MLWLPDNVAITIKFSFDFKSNSLNISIKVLQFRSCFFYINIIAIDQYAVSLGLLDRAILAALAGLERRDFWRRFFRAFIGKQSCQV